MNQAYVEQCATRALQDLLAGRVPSRADLSPLTGEIKACIDALQEALHIDGAPTVQKSFKALVVDRDWLGKLTTAQPVPRTPDYNLFHLHQTLITGEAAPSAPLDSYGPFGDWQDIATEMYAAWADRGPTGLKNYIRAFTDLRQKTDAQTRLIRLLSGEPPAAGKEEQKPERRIRFLPLSDFLRRPRQQWLIPDILPRDGLALVYGESGGYKSFLVMDWSFCMATGTPWLGRRVTHGYVAYVVAEGSYGIEKRTNAWLVHHQRFFDKDDTSKDQEFNQQMLLRLYDESIMLQDLSQVAELLTALQEDFPEPPVMVVIDTLSRCSAGADEVSNTDMAKVLASADLIRQQLHCTILIVHHEGKDKERGPRGASALLANIETAILVTPVSVGTKVESIKAKDAPKFNPIRLEAQEVRFGPYPDDTSLILVPLVGGDEEEDKPKMTDTEARMYALLVKAGKELTYTEWLNAGKEAHLNDRLASEAVTSLKRSGLVQQSAKRGPYSVAQDQPQEPFESESTP